MAKKKKTEELSINKGKELFDFIDMVYVDQRMSTFDSMTDEEKKRYKNSKYMIHRFLSMNPVYSQVVNVIQKYTQIPERMHYLFLTSMLPKGKQYNKYIKGDKETKYEGWLVDLLVKHFGVSKAEAINYLDIYYEKNRPALRLLCELYGIDSKVLKKAKL